MKSSQIGKIVLNITLFLLSTLATIQAHAQVNLIKNVFDLFTDQISITEAVPPITVGGLDKYHGQYLKVYYVVGKSQFLDQKVQIQVREMKRIDLAKIEQSEIALPSVRVVKKSIFAAYNFVILVVSPDPNYTLFNPDGTIAPGQAQVENITKDNSAVMKVALSKEEILGPSMQDGVYIPGQLIPDMLVPFKINL